MKTVVNFMPVNFRSKGQFELVENFSIRSFLSTRSDRFLYRVNTILIVFFLFSSIPTSAQSNSELGIEAYGKSDFHQAIQYFTLALEETPNSPEVLYNLGNTHFKNNELGKAIVFWKRSLQVNPGCEDAQQNLNLAYEQRKDKIDAAPAYSLKMWPSTVLSNSKPSLWGVLALITLFLTAILFLLSHFKRNRNFISLLVGGSLTIIFTALGIFNHNVLTPTNQAVIIQREIDVQTEPKISSTAFVLHEGTEVTILNELEGWLEISIPSGNTGWVSKTSVLIV